MLRQFIEELETGARTEKDLLEQCLARISECDGEVCAWVEISPQPSSGSGPLNGIPFGVKDIVETRDLATSYGSPLYTRGGGTRDADVVARLRRLGAILLGKTQTTAFAYYDAAPTRNPRAPGCTPGGSSSGSAAAVAAGMAAFAIGSQTQGSVLRPASYCGVAGFKPTFGRIPTDGVLPFAPSLDTVGFFTQTVDDMAAFWSRSFGTSVEASVRKAARLHFDAAPEMQSAVDLALSKLRAEGVQVDNLDLPAGFDRFRAAITTVNEYEGARSHEARWREFGDRIGPKLAGLVRRGLALAGEEYRAALAEIEAMKKSSRALFREYPVIFTPAATGAAPVGLSSTGDPSANSPWTALGVPAISIPMPGDGPPLGLQAVAAWEQDDALIAMARDVESLLCR